MDVSNGASCDRGIRFDACSDFDVGGEEIFLSCCLFSAMAPERVLPSPPSDGGLLRGEEVVRDEILEVVGEGGEDAMLPLSQLVERGLHARRAWCVGLRGLVACASCCTWLTLDVRDGGG